MSLIDGIVQTCKDVLGPGEHLLHEPWLKGREGLYISSVLDSNHLAAGKWVDRFESAVAEFVGAKYAVAVMNATSGLHAAISVMPRLKQYRVPSMTFVATANAVAYGGNNIKFVEFRNPADIVVDFLGHPHAHIGCLIRDAAQSLGSKQNGKYIGSSGTAVFSFNQNKIITTGGGGMIVTDDEGFAQEIRHLVTTARVQHKWETAHNAVAWNYRMSDLTAAVGVAQMEQLPTILSAKRALAKAYRDKFVCLDGVRFIDEPEGCESNYWLNAIQLSDSALVEPCLIALHDAGICARRLWTPIHHLPMYAKCETEDLTHTDNCWESIICLPSSPKFGFKYA